MATTITINHANVPYFQSYCILQFEIAYENEILTDPNRPLVFISFFPAWETEKSAGMTFQLMVAVGRKAIGPQSFLPHFLSILKLQGFY